MTMTRRGLSNAMAQLGGAGAAYETLVLFDFLKPPPAMAAGLALPSDAGRGRTVAILGAGVAGLSAAYEPTAPATTSSSLRRRTASAGAT